MRREGCRGRLCRYLLCVCANKIYLVALSRCPTRLNSRNYLPCKLPADITCPEASRLVGLSRGSLSRACICIRPKACVLCLRLRACVLCLRLRACVLCLRPRACVPVPVPTLEPRRSKRTLSIPGHYAVLAGRGPRKFRRGENV